MIFLVPLIMLIGLYFMTIAFLAAFASWRCSRATRQVRLDVARWRAKRGL